MVPIPEAKWFRDNPVRVTATNPTALAANNWCGMVLRLARDIGFDFALGITESLVTLVVVMV
jgi:hypothetical protein